MLRHLCFAFGVLAFGLATPASAADPSLNRMGIVFHLKPHFHKPEWTWTPSIRFKVAGPIASSSVISVDYTLPGGKAWIKVDCENVSATSETEFLTVNDCGFRQEDAVATNQTGVFGFTIRISDALAGTNKTMFSGKFTVGKQLYNPDKLPAKTKQFYYYVDNDWRLPIGFVGTWLDSANQIYAEVWVKRPIADLSKVNGYLFFNGKQVAESTASFTLASTPPETPGWTYQLLQVKFRALTDKPASESYDGWWKAYENPGVYEIKILRDGKLARSVKFTVKDGKPVDAGVAASIGLRNGALVPVTVLGDADGTWRKDAWKTEAFYSNPVKGL